jgi:hypothetical protein
MRSSLLAALAAVLLTVAAPASAFADGTISGTVRATEDGGPIAGQQVELWNEAATIRLARTCTRADGYYSFTHPEGTYLVHFAGAGTCGGERRYTPEWFANRYTIAFATPVPIIGLGIGGIDALLEPQSQIQGTVTARDTGAGVANIAVEVLDITQRPVGRACTAANGTYTVGELVPGPLLVRFSSDWSCGPVESYRVQYFDESDALAGSRPVNLGPAETITAVNARLRVTKPTYTLGLSTAGAGSGQVTAGALTCTTVCSAPIEEGTAVNVVAVPDAGSTFAGWSGACAGAAACTFPMGPSDATVIATFAKSVETVAPGGTATPTATPVAGGATPQPGASPTPTAGRGPACTVKPTAKTKSGKLKVVLKCDARSTLTLTGSVKVGRTTLKLKAVKATAAARTVSITLPAKARSALRGRKTVSATLTLVAKTAAGETRVTARVKQLR